jgi:hypothetical protein
MVQTRRFISESSCSEQHNGKTARTFDEKLKFCENVVRFRPSTKMDIKTWLCSSTIILKRITYISIPAL